MKRLICRVRGHNQGGWCILEYRPDVIQHMHVCRRCYAIIKDETIARRLTNDGAVIEGLDPDDQATTYLH